MKTIQYNKIIRDKIPQVISAAGKKAVIRQESAQQTVLGLEQKLSEELGEYLQDHSLEEMADILEVLHGILHHRGISWEQLEAVRLEKKEKRGGFEKGLRLLEVIESEGE